jgi:hypothetical protein
MPGLTSMVTRNAQGDVTIVVASAHQYKSTGLPHKIPEFIPHNPPVRKKGNFYGTKQQHAA